MLPEEKQIISPIKLPNKEDVLIYQPKDSFHYELEDLTDETMISSISDTMFMAMFNNTNRIKCPASLLSAIYGLDKKKVYKNIKLIAMLDILGADYNLHILF